MKTQLNKECSGIIPLGVGAVVGAGNPRAFLFEGGVDYPAISALV